MSARLRSSTRASVASEPTKQKSEPKMESTTTKRTVTTRSSRGAPDFNKLKNIAFVAFAGAILFVALGAYLVHNNTLVLYPKSIDAGKLSGFAARAEYALRYQVLLLLWLSFNVHAVIYRRLSTLAINPLIESTEKHVQLIKNILTNSLEHIFLSFFAQLTFVSFGDPSLILKFIPAINITQFIGRIFFLLGYPYYRTFGFVLTSLPNSLLIAYNLYRFGSFVNLY